MSLLQQLRRRLFGSAVRLDGGATTEPEHAVKTQFSATIFSGEAEPWVEYLSTKRADRYEDDWRMSILWSDRNKLLKFREETESSRPLARCLNEAFTILRRRVSVKPHVQDTFDRMVFDNRANGETDLCVRLSSTLPSEASREIQFDDELAPVDVNIVLQSDVVQAVLDVYGSLPESADDEERLGRAWPVVRRVLSQLGYPNDPRDRFVEKIDLITRSSVIAVNVLYDDYRKRRLVPNRVGTLYQEFVSRRHGIDPAQLIERHPYFRLLNELAFMLDEHRFRGYAAEAKILVREYLDQRYLRLSLAGAMPGVTESLKPMAFGWEKGSVVTPVPQVGSYGILDHQDLKAWRKVEGPFREMGFTLLRQVGMGEFGRVYEAVNHSNPRIPDRVALKVDRIRSWKKAKTILDAQTLLQISRDLAPSPHVIRIYDAGRLERKKYTYHVLQFIDGDTLDNLLGVTGTEHASIHRPLSPQECEEAVGQSTQSALRGSAGEGWRRRRLALPFAETLSLSQTLDLLTSVLLWLEEIHHLGYANNDLKNGNLMVSRRGQIKGIDMDSYSPTFSPLDRVTDFYFLAVSLMLFFLNISSPNEKPSVIGEDDLQSHATIRRLIDKEWPFKKVQQISRGRVTNRGVVDLLATIIQRSRDRTYASDLDRFSTDINRLIAMKRQIFSGEIVLD